MSDAPSVQHSAAVRAALARCTGPEGCPCGGHRSASKDTGGSSPARSESSGSEGSTERASDAQASDSVVPDAETESEWSGLGTVRVPRCHCGNRAHLRRCWGGRNTGRRFLGCPVKPPACRFVEWMDDPWPQRVQDSFRQLCTELKRTKRGQVLAHEELIDALKCADKYMTENEDLKKEMAKTKDTAVRSCLKYERKMKEALVGKEKLLRAVYILLAVVGVLVSLLAVIAMKA